MIGDLTDVYLYLEIETDGDFHYNRIIPELEDGTFISKLNNNSASMAYKQLLSMAVTASRFKPFLEPYSEDIKKAAKSMAYDLYTMIDNNEFEFYENKAMFGNSYITLAIVDVKKSLFV